MLSSDWQRFPERSNDENFYFLLSPLLEVRARSFSVDISEPVPEDVLTRLGTLPFTIQFMEFDPQIIGVYVPPDCQY